jgi:hypothetical protein
MVINVDKIIEFKEMISSLRNLEINLYQLLRDILQRPDVEALLIKMNKDNLYDGKRSDMSKLAPPYTNFTKKTKRRKGQPIDRVTWKDSGRLYDSLTIDHRSDEIEFVVDVGYYVDLKEKYSNNGIDGLGLPIDEVIKVIKPIFTEALRDAIFNKSATK